jgi:hypothetical protein
MLQTCCRRFLQKFFADVLIVQGEQQMTVYIGGGFGTFFLVTSVFSALQRCALKSEL